MNLPNKLTIFRVILIPFFVFFLLTDVLGANGDYLALVIFIVASLTDMLDGKIARKYNLVTNFGKSLPAWIVIIIIAREFIISGFRLIAAEHQIVIAASMWGKFKTTFQMAMIILLILSMNADVYVAGVGIIHVLALIATYVALVLTIVSLLDYLYKNKAVLKEQD